MLVRFASYILPLLLLAACSSQPSKVDEQPEQLTEQDTSSESTGDSEPQDSDSTDADGEVPTALSNMYKRGVTLMKSERYPQAKDLWLAASERFPDFPGVWVNLALSQYHVESYEEAKEALDKALTLDAEFCPAYKTQGLVARELGDFKLAEQSYISAIECAPEDGNVRRNLGILYDLYLHDERKALEQYEAAKRLYFAKDKNLEIWITNLKSRLPQPEPEPVVTEQPAPDTAVEGESATQPANAETGEEAVQSEASSTTEVATEASAQDAVASEGSEETAQSGAEAAEVADQEAAASNETEGAE